MGEIPDRSAISVQVVSSSESSELATEETPGNIALNTGVYTAIQYWNSRKETWSKALEDKFAHKDKKRGKRRRKNRKRKKKPALE